MLFKLGGEIRTVAQMTTALVTHSAGLNHVTPPGHPEQVARLEAINAALAAPDFADLHREDAPAATDAHIRLAHHAPYIARVKATAPDDGFAALDADTHMSPGSFEAAIRGVGANIRAVDLVMTGEVQNAFAAMRPPGHHAETETAMGFCFFGNVVIGARHAMETYGLNRVAIVDFDVHHGNGTQDLVWDDERILFVSSHQMPLYPGSGHASETGAHGQIVNIPLVPNTGGKVFREKYENIAFRAVADHKPELILISAGFDAHAADPLANLLLVEDDFAWVTHGLCDLADTHCGGRVVSTLEGGYDLDALASSVDAHVRVLMERGA